MSVNRLALNDLRNRTALVTGASGGIGRAIAVRLSARGARLCVVGRDQHRLDATIRAVYESSSDRDATVLGVTTDLTGPGRIQDLTDEVERMLGDVDILVHAAGIYERDTLEKTSVKSLDELYRANVRVPYELTQATLAALVRRHGDVVFINSTQGLSASGGIGGYAATQHAMKAVGESLRSEVNSLDVRVTTIHLGRTATRLQESIFAAEERTYTPELLIQPDDVADVVVNIVALPRRTQIASLTLLPTHKG